MLDKKMLLNSTCIFVFFLNFARKMNNTTIMAPKKKKYKKQAKPNRTSLKEIFLSETTNFVLGLILTLLAVVVFIAMFSYLSTAANDQSLLEHLKPGEIRNPERSFQNVCGSLGAILSHFFIAKCFGWSAFIIPVFVFLSGLKQMGAYARTNLWKWFLCSAIIMIWCSVAFAKFLSPLLPELTYNPGGNHGVFVSNFIENMLGIPGLIVILVLVAILFLVYISSETINVVRNILNPKRYLNQIKFTIHGNNKPAEIEEELEEEPEPEEEFLNPVTSEPIPLMDEEVDESPEQEVLDTEKEEIKGDEEFGIIVAKDEEKASGETLAERENIKTPINPKEPFLKYKYPTLSLLKKYDVDNQPFIDKDELLKKKDRIIEVLRSFKVEISKIDATVGPTITLYEITPAEGIRISKIRNLSDDLALNLAATGVRIIAPIPGKGTIGIEVPNERPNIVSMESILNSKKFQNTKMDLPIALGKTITNDVYMVDLAKIPHLLVAGATGQGKSVGLNAIITSLLYKKHPNELKFVLIDPKKVEFSVYSSIANHFIATVDDDEEPIITDVTKVVRTLNSLCTLMDRRYDLLKQAGARNIKEYNEKYVTRKLRLTDGHEYMPYIVVIIDEFGDLIMTAGKEIELPIARIAQLARAVGIHMVIATQRPTTNIITGTIKANFPGRMAFRVSAMIDSRTILDRPGSEQLVGRGDMLIINGSEPVRVQCAFIDTPEVEAINEYIKNQPGPTHTYELPEPVVESGSSAGGTIDASSLDPMFEDAARAVVSTQQGSTSMIQRRFSIGYNRAGRLMDALEKAGIVGEQHGGKPREVLVQDEASLNRILESLK